MRILTSDLQENGETFLLPKEPAVWGVIVNFEKVQNSSLDLIDGKKKYTLQESNLFQVVY